MTTTMTNRLETTMTTKRMRSDWRSCPKDLDVATGLSFVSYLVGPFTRGYDWLPDRPPSGVMKIHESRPEGGVGPMRPFFLRWLEGKLRADDPQPVAGVTHAQVKRAIERARRREPDIVAVLLWRQEPSGIDKRTTKRMLAQYSITATTLGRRFDKAIRLVAEELAAELNGQRYADEGA